MGADEADRGKRGRWWHARLVGAGETGGGRQGWWGQARPMGAVRRRAKPLGKNANPVLRKTLTWRNTNKMNQ